MSAPRSQALPPSFGLDDLSLFCLGPSWESRRQRRTVWRCRNPWNRLGTVPALRGEKGSVRELVPIAHDGLHFEVARRQ